MVLTELETRLLEKLAPRLYTAILYEISLHTGILQEIRIRLNQHLAITVQGKSIQLSTLCTVADLEETLANLCSNSLYSHSETIREGYICVEGGIRVGICGRAVTSEDRITAVRDIHYICIRIPHRFPGAADDLFNRLEEENFQVNALIFGKPGSGKTTVLRELILKLSECDSPKKIAVIDTRFELTAGLPIKGMVDILSGYPRHKGILNAVRTLAPEYIVCDEIMTEEDYTAVKNCVGSGVYICASIHGNPDDIQTRIERIDGLAECFSIYYDAKDSRRLALEYCDDL